MKAIAAVVLALSASNAGATTGNELLSLCQASREFCSGFIQGWASGHETHVSKYLVDYFGAQGISPDEWQAEQEAAKSRGFCVPPMVLASQVTDVVLDYIQVHPATRHVEVGYLIQAAMSTAFPCQKD